VRFEHAARIDEEGVAAGHPEIGDGGQARRDVGFAEDGGQVEGGQLDGTGAGRHCDGL
jgi:hypothetical protein